VISSGGGKGQFTVGHSLESLEHFSRLNFDKENVFVVEDAARGPYFHPG